MGKYRISLNYFGASALGEAGEIHKKTSADIFNTLYEKGALEKLSTPQFFDEELGVFLNGRQVIGKCPIEGCTSEKAYADECSLGHQYMPSELIDPISVLSGKKPVFVNVTNWYYKLEDDIDYLKECIQDLRVNSNRRKYEMVIIDEFLNKPAVHIPKKYLEGIDQDALLARFPEHELIDEEKRKSLLCVFTKWIVWESVVTIVYTAPVTQTLVKSFTSTGTESGKKSFQSCQKRYFIAPTVLLRQSI